VACRLPSGVHSPSFADTFRAEDYDGDVFLEGCRWTGAFVHPKGAHGVLIFLGQWTPVAADPI
jgi:hypothetical protein